MARALNIAHRGFTKEFPDNTLAAFQAAIEIGVGGIEFDVHETADSNFIVFHDAEIKGTNISDLSLAQIEKVKLEKKYKIPTLEETLDLCRNRVKMLVELKQVRSLDRLLLLLRSRAVLNDVTIASFNPELMKKLSLLAPEMRRGIITGLPVEEPAQVTQPARASVIIMRLRFASKELVARIHRNKLTVFVWDCAGLRQVRQALELGVDGIISDSPDLVVRGRRA